MQDDSYHLLNHEEIDRQLKDLASSHLSSTIRALQTDDLVIKQANVRGISTAPAILEYAKENDIDLIVIGTHGRRGLGHLFLGSVAEEVVRLSAAPVLTIREREEPKPVTMMKQILVPLDFSNFFAQENNSDLIVIATHGRTGIEHMLMGSVTEKVVRRAHNRFWNIDRGRSKRFLRSPDIQNSRICRDGISRTLSCQKRFPPGQFAKAVAHHFMSPQPQHQPACQALL